MTSPVLIHNARIAAPEGILDGWLLSADRRIARIGLGAPPALPDALAVDAAGAWLMPGFIDVHVHGAVAHDTMDATPDALRAMARFFAAHGVTGFLATTMTGSREATTRALENAAACLGPMAEGAALLGVHLEGPYINVKAKGAQDGQHVRPADPAEYRPWLDLDVIRQVTVAPEIGPNGQFIQDCAARGVVVSLGHTTASYEQIRDAVRLGASQVTHTFNAMTGIHHRQPGTAGAALTQPEITCELIADTIHVHPAIMRLVALAKAAGGGRAGRLIVITDAMRGAGLGDGTFDLGGQAVTVRGATATLADGTLAGSILTMDRALWHMAQVTGEPMGALWHMMSGRAAEQIRLPTKGVIRTGCDADLTVIGDDGTVQITLVAGQIVHRA